MNVTRILPLAKGEIQRGSVLKRLFLALMVSSSLLLPVSSAMAATYPHCRPFDGAAGYCPESQCGAIMCGITDTCAKDGNCYLPDVVQVGINVGNFLLGLVALVAFAAFVWGGFQMIFGGAKSGWYDSGKKTLRAATFGLLITLAAGALVQVLNSALRTGGELTGTAKCDALSTNSQFWACVDTAGQSTLTPTQQSTCKPAARGADAYCPGSGNSVLCCCIAGECGTIEQ